MVQWCSVENDPEFSRKLILERDPIVPLQNDFARKSIYPFILGDSIFWLFKNIQVSKHYDPTAQKRSPKIDRQIKQCNYGFEGHGKATMDHYHLSQSRITYTAYIYICIYIYAYIYMHIYIYAYIYIKLYKYISTHVSIHLSTKQT